jgi:amidase
VDDSLGLAPASQLAEAIRAKEVSSRELLEMFLHRVETINPKINSVVTLDGDRAMAQCKRADEATTKGRPLGPLHGLPITVKDAIEVGGIRSTGGATELSEHVPDADAPAVARLREAGAIVFGKTNVPKWSGDLQTYNDIFGTTTNPWDQTKTTGGSSGGAASAVASGLTSFETGTDIGGSIRVPASFCGVFGHKPSFGIVSQRGYLDSVGGGVTDADINVFGPIARSAEDLDLLLGVLAGPNSEDATAWNLSLPPPRYDDLSEYRIGLWLDDPNAEVDSESVGLLSAAAEALASGGAYVEDEHPPISLAESVGLFHSLILPAISPSLDRDIGEVLGGSYRAWLELHRTRTLLRRVWAKWFQVFDVLLCPVIPSPPFPHDHRGTINDREVQINGRTRSHADLLAWTGLIGVAYLPSTVVPVGRTGAGLPVGVQVVGPYLEDRTSLFVGARLAELTGGYTPPPIS